MRRIEIYDTTLRDGSQAEGITFSIRDKMFLTVRLDTLGFDYIEGGYPGSNEKDLEYFRRVKEMPLKRIKVCAFGMTRRKGTAAEDDRGLNILRQSGAPVITLVGKASAFQATEVLHADLDENLAMIGESVRWLVDAGREVIFDAEHFFDGWKCDPDYALGAVRRAVESGAHRVVLCDTNGGSMVEQITEATKAVNEEFPGMLGIHCHNDCDLAVANTLAGVDAGAVQVQGTINGFGERCGNADLISVIANLSLKKEECEVLDGEALTRFTELSREVYDMVNANFRGSQPYVGRNAFAHKGGMHVSGVSRTTASYEHVDPALVGNQRRVLVSELSGRSNILSVVSRNNIHPDEKLIGKILSRVVEMESAGYQFEGADGSFDLLVRKCAGSYRSHFERVGFHVSIDADPDGTLNTEASVKMRTSGEIRHEVAEGDGPVNALDAAMRKALNGTFPALKKLHLVDYKVRVINSEAATAAMVRVVIESQDEEDVWGTVGVSENIIEASWIALVDSFEYKLHKDEQKLAAGSQPKP